MSEIDPNVKVGKTRSIRSVFGRSGAFNWNVYDSDDSLPVFGLASTKVLRVIADNTTGVDDAIFVALISATLASLNVTAAVLPLIFSSCMPLLVMIPVRMLTVHS
jgi:hypothetical protein